jgi:hypothetical protein
MRRREKFVIASVFLSLGLLGVQYIALDYRYYAIALFTVISYLVSSWALSDDMQRHERLTVVPIPVMYALAVSLFYFLLPETVISRVLMLFFFGVGMYALFLTANIYSVAKGRTIQLLHAAHAVGLLFTLLTSLLFSNTIYSLRLPFYTTSALVGLVHFPLIFMSLWAVRLDSEIKTEVMSLSILFTLMLMEFSMVLSFLPLSVWHHALFIMSVLYLGLGVFHNLLRGRLFQRAINEYSLVAIFIGLIFILMFPLK